MQGCNKWIATRLALPPAAPCRCEYPVSDRANAVRQFFEAAERDPTLIKVGWLGTGTLLAVAVFCFICSAMRGGGAAARQPCTAARPRPRAACQPCKRPLQQSRALHCNLCAQGEWIYMVESDYVFMKPLPLPDAESQVRPRRRSAVARRAAPVGRGLWVLSAPAAAVLLSCPPSSNSERVRFPSCALRPALSWLRLAAEAVPWLGVPIRLHPASAVPWWVAAAPPPKRLCLALPQALPRWPRNFESTRTPPKLHWYYQSRWMLTQTLALPCAARPHGQAVLGTRQRHPWHGACPLPDAGRGLEAGGLAPFRSHTPMMGTGRGLAKRTWGSGLMPCCHCGSNPSTACACRAPMPPPPCLPCLPTATQITPDWEKYTAQVEADPDLVKTLGWVRPLCPPIACCLALCSLVFGCVRWVLLHRAPSGALHLSCHAVPAASLWQRLWAAGARAARTCRPQLDCSYGPEPACLCRRCGRCTLSRWR